MNGWQNVIAIIFNNISSLVKYSITAIALILIAYFSVSLALCRKKKKKI
jgi:hypothetical protein